MSVSIHAEIPSVDTYLDLRKAGGMGSYSAEAARVGLPNSLYSVVLKEGGRPVGMGRLVGDGGCFVQVTDIVVRPECQGRGYARMILEDLMGWIEKNVPDTAYVNLLADVPANRIYEKFGFRETAPKTVGMAKRNGS
ncbi:GNAT family N-acetyltransferase [Roseibium sediminis]|uniref:GNAT family N-acetyltransferase n=1 Tax=Roseibium sediminis TaxID=1775174 RepID=UPI001FCAC49B|nr:GNAT family N-acetyltransferase [Roseibium sediminis]